MTTLGITVVRGAALAALLLGFAGFARDHSPLNGTWTLVASKSDFAGQPAVHSGSVTIDKRQGNTTVSRNFVYDGDTQTVFYSDITDSANHATIHAGKEIKSKTRWDHDVLTVTTTQGSAVTVETYSPGTDGTLRVSVVRPGQGPITMVFERK